MISVSTVHAQTPPPVGGPTNHISSLIQKIAQKFGLKEADVQAVFTEHKQEHMAQMDTRFEEKLTQAVTDGTITDAQKQLILAKHKELREKHQSEMERLKTMTPEQRKTVMQQHHQELEDWAKQNNIDIKYLMGFGKGARKMHRGWRMK